MKRIRVSLLVLVYSVYTYAGDMPNMATGTPPPPPPPPAGASVSAAMEVVLSLLQSILSLL